jgi:hypothetical protein
MGLADVLAGGWNPASVPGSWSSVPSGGPTLSDLQWLPSQDPADLIPYLTRWLNAPPVAPPRPSGDTLASAFNLLLSSGGISSAIARNQSQAGYPSFGPGTKGGGSGLASLMVPASYSGGQSLAGTPQPQDYGGSGYGDSADPTATTASSPSPDASPSNAPDAGAQPSDPSQAGPLPPRTPLSGYAIDVDPGDPEAVQRAYDILSGNLHPTKTESAIRGALQGASFNLNDRLFGAAKASGISPLIPGSELLGAARLGAEALVPSIFGHAATDRYDQTVSMERAANALAERENPRTYKTSEFVGNLVADRALSGVPRFIKSGLQLGGQLLSSGAAPSASAGDQALSLSSGASAPAAAPFDIGRVADLLSAGRRRAGIRSGLGSLAAGQAGGGGASSPPLSTSAGGAPPALPAQTPPGGELPQFLYRGDWDIMYDVFTDGFKPRGTSMDLLLHAEDNRDPPSGYVSTTTSPEVAWMFGPKIYVVRTPDNAIDVNATLGPSTPQPKLFEFAVPGPIPGHEVRGVTNPKRGISWLNPNYIPRK